MRFGGPLLLVLLLATAPAAGATVLPVSVNKSFYNENWFPLSKKDMEEAAIDTALDQISAKGLLAFVPADQGSGRLDMKVTLVEPAQRVKVTIELDAEGFPSAVATASTSINGLDHDGIYGAFEHVGREAAERLNARLVYLNATKQQSPAPVKAAPAQTRLSPMDPLPPRSCDDPLLKRLTTGDRARWSMKAIYQRGQQLKEKFCYFDARVAFEAVVADERWENASWRQLAENELIYGLPLFEARQLWIHLSPLIKDESKGWSEISTHLRRIELLYRQILVENESNVERVMSTQAELDNFHLSWEALKGSLEFNSDSQIDFLNRSIRADMAAHGGELPVNREELETRLATALRQYEVVRYQVIRRTGQATLQVRHKRWGAEWEIVFNDDFEIRSKRLH